MARRLQWDYAAGCATYTAAVFSVSSSAYSMPVIADDPPIVTPGGEWQKHIAAGGRAA